MNRVCMAKALDYKDSTGNRLGIEVDESISKAARTSRNGHDHQRYCTLTHIASNRCIASFLFFKDKLCHIMLIVRIRARLPECKAHCCSRSFFGVHSIHHTHTHTQIHCACIRLDVCQCVFETIQYNTINSKISQRTIANACIITKFSTPPHQSVDFWSFFFFSPFIFHIFFLVSHTVDFSGRQRRHVECVIRQNQCRLYANN